MGAALNLLRLDPIKSQFWAAVINGLVAAPVKALASNPTVMGKFGLPVYLSVAGWIGTGLMLATSVGMIASVWR